MLARLTTVGSRVVLAPTVGSSSAGDDAEYAESRPEEAARRRTGDGVREYVVAEAERMEPRQWRIREGMGRLVHVVVQQLRGRKLEQLGEAEKSVPPVRHQ